MPNKLTDTEIKKALECCSQSGDFTKTQDEICSPCPYSSYGDCTGLLKANTLDLINRTKANEQHYRQKVQNQKEELKRLNEVVNRQYAEIEELKCKNSNLTSDLTSLQNDLTSSKAEVERLKRSNKISQHLLSNAYDSIERLSNFIENIKAEAYKEFADRFENRILPILTTATLDEKDFVCTCIGIKNNLLNELVGGNNE